MALFWVLLAITGSVTSALQCHQCAGSDAVGSLLQKALTNFNITLGQSSGDCKSETGDNMCTGTACQKSVVAYKVSYSGISYTYETYVKGCSANATQKVGQCTDVATDATGGYTKTSSVCLCDDKDFCNGASMLSTIAAPILFLVFTLPFVLQ
ncbi:unnamed protein product, partial [Mesorhabditis spiculigera]